MHLSTILTLASAFCFSSFVPLVAAQLITADNHSFGGVSFPLLQYYRPDSRDKIIRAIVKSKARVIRLHIQPDSHHNDPEVSIGEFDKSLLDQFDDTLAAIHRISEGQVKVVIAPHDAHALRGTNDVPCDAYCKKLGGAFLDFYSLEEYRTLYKTRLDVFFKHYPSKNFGGRSWNELSEVIMVRNLLEVVRTFTQCCVGATPSRFSADRGVGRRHSKSTFQWHLAYSRWGVLAM
jgi:hypothetical protein